MSPRPRFTTKLGKVRNAVLRLLLLPFRWLSPGLQLLIGFSSLIVLTTLLLTQWPLTMKSIGLLVLVSASYLVVWRFVDHRAGVFDLSISKRRAFALVGSAIMVETALVRVGLLLTAGLSAQRTHPAFNDPEVWSYAIPFAATACQFSARQK